MNAKGLMAAVMTVASMTAVAQAAYVFSYNPGPTRGTKWMAKASTGDVEAAVGVVNAAPRPVWARVCYTIGPSDTTVTIYAQTRKDTPVESEIAWGGCADVFGTSIWIGNPHEQPVGGYYGVAPGTPSD